jgi:LysR family transcriptional activator of nhaA
MRRVLEDWFDSVDVNPRVVAEFDDSALLKAFGEAALGVYPAPSAIAEEVASMYHSVELGSVDKIRESYFAISPERKLKHPAVLQITERARARLAS